MDGNTWVSQTEEETSNIPLKRDIWTVVNISEAAPRGEEGSCTILSSWGIEVKLVLKTQLRRVSRLYSPTLLLTPPPRMEEDKGRLKALMIVALHREESPRRRLRLTCCPPATFSTSVTDERRDQRPRGPAGLNLVIIDLFSTPSLSNQELQM